MMGEGGVHNLTDVRMVLDGSLYLARYAEIPSLVRTAACFVVTHLKPSHASSTDPDFPHFSRSPHSQTSIYHPPAVIRPPTFLILETARSVLVPQQLLIS